MGHIRSSNGAGHKAQNMRVPTELELAALEDFGPMARSVIVNGPMPILAYPIMSQIIEINDQIEAENAKRELAGRAPRPYLDPKDPELDKRLAQAVIDENMKVMNKDREIDFCLQGLKPFRPRHGNPKTAREEAIAARRLRRMRW